MGAQYGFYVVYSELFDRDVSEGLVTIRTVVTPMKPPAIVFVIVGKILREVLWKVTIGCADALIVEPTINQISLVPLAVVSGKRLKDGTVWTLDGVIDELALLIFLHAFNALRWIYGRPVGRGLARW